MNAFSVATLMLLLAANPTMPVDDPATAYESRERHGWQLMIHQRFVAEQPELLDRVLVEVERQLAAIETAVPELAVQRLKKIQIWIELNDSRFPCMCYHVNKNWLRSHGLIVEKTGGVELANPYNFLVWTKHQPSMILHELAHGYHDQFVADGYQNAAIADAWRAAKSNRYGKVNHVGGGKRDHYAATNPMEYFAEASEAFWRNDFYPFERAELREYDPRAVELLQELWCLPAQEAAVSP